MPNITKRPLSEKEFKNLLVYNILRDKKEISRADLTSITNINAVSISNYTNAFIKKGLFTEKQFGASSGGRPPIILELESKNNCAIGLSVSRNKIIGTVANLAGERMGEMTEKKLDTGDIKNAALSVISDLKKMSSQKLIKGVGLSAEKDNCDTVGLDRMLADEFNTEVYTSEPAVTSAYIEYLTQTGYEAKKFLYSHGDTGECIYFDHHGMYTCEDDGIESCRYLKAWDSEMSVENTAKKMVKQGMKTEITKYAEEGEVTDYAVYHAAADKDALACEIVEFSAINLGVRLSYLINSFSPERLVIGGRAKESGPLFIDSVKNSIKKFALENISGKLEVFYSNMQDESAAMGAAALVVREIFMGA